jgi:glycosyltransferase involved in cell wall biosynthesis
MQGILARLGSARRRKLMFLVTEDWYFVSHRLPLAVAAREAGFDVVVATRVDRHGELIRDSGLTLAPVNFNRSGMRPFEELRTLAHIVKLYRQHAPDIVHHIALKPVIYGSLAARIARVKGVVNALGGLGYVFSSSKRHAKALRMLARPALKFALSGVNLRLIVQNADDRKRIVDGGLARSESVRLIRGAGVDPRLYARADVVAMPPLAVLPARLLWDKGVGDFVAAAGLLKERGVEARFALVGQPDKMNPASVTQAEVDAWVRDGTVEAWGWREDMPHVFAQAQIVCLPTYHEGFPKVLLEAAASGCAIVTTDIPGCREFVRDGDSGWLVPPGDVAALADALRTAIENPALRESRAGAAYAMIEVDFSMDRVIGETFGVYAELLDPID